jgi:hypothetical protein
LTVKIIKLLKLWLNPHVLVFRSGFLAITPKARTTKDKLNKLDFSKPKTKTLFVH